MKIKLIATIVITVSLIWSSAPANSAGSRQPITAENGSQLRELFLLGQGTVNDITWSPDGKTFIVSTACDQHPLQSIVITANRLS